MKKTVSIMLAIVFVLSLFAGCNKEVDSDNVKDCYILFLREHYKESNGSFVIKDIDGDNIDELIVSQNTTITIYTFKDEVTRVDSHDFETGTLRLLYSENHSYPGIIYFYVGFGEDIYGYMTIKDYKLIFEKLWIDRYSTEEPNSPDRISVISKNKELIEESKISYNENKDIKFLSINEIN